MGTLRVEDRSAGVRWLTLDRPPANAENETLLADLLAAIEQASSDPTVRAVVLTGGGKFFSGGFDLSQPRGEQAFRGGEFGWAKMLKRLPGVVRSLARRKGG